MLPRAPANTVLLRSSCIMLAASALLPLTYLFPPFDLNGPLAVAAFWIAESGGTSGIPLIGLALTVLFVGFTCDSWKERTVALFVIVLGLLTFLGLGAYLNEHVVKPQFAVWRPNIVELAESSSHPLALKMSVDDFYALPSKESRSEHLEDKVLTEEFAAKYGLHEHVRRHWIVESGYSFPSGHSFSSMLFATFFLGLALSYLAGSRLWVFHLVAVWAVVVCFSRPILRVHSPTDVCVGGLEGVAAGTLAFLFVRSILVKLTT